MAISCSWFYLEKQLTLIWTRFSQPLFIARVFISKNLGCLIFCYSERSAGRGNIVRYLIILWLNSSYIRV